MGWTFYNSSGQLLKSGAAAGGVTSGGTDNAILRADGTGGSTSQGSGITINDCNHLLDVGNASSEWTDGVLYIARTAAPRIDFEGHGADENPILIRFNKSRHASLGGHTTLASGDEIFDIQAKGSDGDSYEIGASFKAVTTEAWDASGRGTKLVFSTAAACSTSNSTRVTIKCSGDVDLANNDLLNVGAADNDWTTDAFTLKGGSNAQLLTVESTGTAVTAGILLKTAASGSDGGSQITFQEGAGNGAANNKLYLMGYRPGCGFFRMRSNSAGGASSAACIIRIPDDQGTIDANATWDDNVFDAYDDAAVLSRAFSPEHRTTEYVDGTTILRGNYCELIDLGVLRRYDDGWVGYNDQRMAALLAGGIYQTRHRVDGLEERIAKLEAQIA